LKGKFQTVLLSPSERVTYYLLEKSKTIGFSAISNTDDLDELEKKINSERNIDIGNSEHELLVSLWFAISNHAGTILE
jgi:hypothetical protein